MSICTFQHTIMGSSIYTQFTSNKGNYVCKCNATASFWILRQPCGPPRRETRHNVSRPTH
ncbi:hypothetical protein CGRA01v4_04301 [Colletotrichum graminicola]|nr:hypothetical protein CGRA01v4_04301 [Colletotrichum graminicola]